MADIHALGDSAKYRTFTAHGVAEYLESTPVRQRRILLDYLFPDEAKAKIIQRQPARELAQRYFLAACDPALLHEAIDKYSAAPAGEKPHARSRRLAGLEAAQTLAKLAQEDPFVAERVGNRLTIPISGLFVRASIDLIGHDPRTGRPIAVIFNASASISRNESQLKHYAKVHCEIATRALSLARIPDAHVWYVDIVSAKRIKAQAQGSKMNWRNLEVACDRIAIEMRELVSRRQRAAVVDLDG